mgnify:FL=1
MLLVRRVSRENSLAIHFQFKGKESLMGMENLYKEVMDLNMMDDNDQK